jgi:hypothetical protein
MSRDRLRRLQTAYLPHAPNSTSSVAVLRIKDFCASERLPAGAISLACNSHRSFQRRAHGDRPVPRTKEAFPLVTRDLCRLGRGADAERSVDDFPGSNTVSRSPFHFRLQPPTVIEFHLKKAGSNAHTLPAFPQPVEEAMGMPAAKGFLRSKLMTGISGSIDRGYFITAKRAVRFPKMEPEGCNQRGKRPMFLDKKLIFRGMELTGG